MRIAVLFCVLSLALSVSCGGEDENESPADSTASSQQDTEERMSIEYTGPQDAITGAYNLIGETDSIVDAVNERTEELQEMIGDI